MQDLNIKRQYGTAIVTVSITDDSVGVSVPFADYMEMLIEEMGQVTTVMTKAQLRAKMLEAAQRLDLNLKSQVKPWANLVKR